MNGISSSSLVVVIVDW